MQINIPPSEQAQLAALAASRGFDSAEEYASSIVSNAVKIEAFAELSPEDLQTSARDVEIGLQQAKDGQGVPAQEAVNEIAAKYGLRVQQ